MKNSNKSTITTGIVLLCIAAFFTISLMLQALDFGVTASADKNIFYMLGNILFNVYGFSSSLIPLFLFIAGLSCFATKWSARKSMRLLTAIVPFFTAVITENICRSILALEHSGFPGVKVFVALVTGLMLIIIELLGAGIIADKINPILFGNKKTAPGKHSSVNAEKEGGILSEKSDDNKSESENKESLSDLKSGFGSIGKLNTSGLLFGKKDSENSENPEGSFEKTGFEEAEEIEVLSEGEDREADKDAEVSETEEDSQIKNEVSSVFDQALSQVKPDENTDFQKEAERENEDYAEPSASIITEEEYAALTDFGSDQADADELLPEDNVEDELEWNNLPPKQESLPPDYDENYNPQQEIDENDPALKFPPEEEEIAEEKTVSEEDPFSAFDINFENQDQKDKENAYSAAKYIDTVVENPNFGHGITLREGDQPSDDSETEEKKTSEPEKAAFPTKINLSDEASYPEEENKSRERPASHVVGQSSFLPASFEADEDRISRAAANSSALYAASHREQEEKSDTFGSSDVFEEMENDIRKESLQKISEETEQAYLNGELKQDNAHNNGDQAVEEQTEEDDFDQSQIANFDEDETIEIPLSARDLTDDGSSEIRAMEAGDSDGQEEDRMYDEESLAFNDEVKGNYRASDAFSHDDSELQLQEEAEPESAEILPNPPRIGNRAVKKGPYVIPSDLLTAYKDDQYWIIDDATKESALNLTQTLAEFNIEAKVIAIKKGPVVTMFEILPAPGVRLQKIVALQDNIALSLAAQSVRIVAPIPGKQAVGIEVPNRHRSIVGFRELIEMKLDEWDKMAVPVVLGKDILGKAQLIDLVKTPHMLIAGATGSGKSVCVNSLILSILYKRSFRDVKLILVDPKVVELKLYNNIPHLLVPVITEPKKALQALQWCLCEMERRYALLDSMGVRDISTYNQRIKEREIATEKLPYIVVIIDEFADLMATSGRELESTVARLTAMSRAVGIHLVLATQRPSVNVITGLIKANIPSRIAFMVSSRTDSNIIIDSVGAEKLLGRGDMLYASAVDPAPVRIQGTYISDQEVEDVVKAVKEYGEPDYIDEQVFFEDDEEEGDDFELNGNYDGDPLYDQALEIVIQSGKASASYLQRRLSIGYNRAARLVEEMEERGIVGPANGSKPREIIHVPG